ncbi:MAG: GNAT family N-acetyltransferase, partial [Bdellovibrionales bacterium]|nr:GNAT family N-acetyltransferase [Oligoflexia bacterium]
MNFELRKVKVGDAAAVLKIYEPYVRASHITFETEMPTETEFQNKIEKTLQKYPWYVALVEGQVVGYAYANLFRERAAYAWALESSIYLADDFQG